jgi:hypothetical protein
MDSPFAAAEVTPFPGVTPDESKEVPLWKRLGWESKQDYRKNLARKRQNRLEKSIAKEKMRREAKAKEEAMASAEEEGASMVVPRVIQETKPERFTQGSVTRILKQTRSGPELTAIAKLEREEKIAEHQNRVLASVAAAHRHIDAHFSCEVIDAAELKALTASLETVDSIARRALGLDQPGASVTSTTVQVGIASPWADMPAMR